MFTILLIISITTAVLVAFEYERQRRAKHRAQTRGLLVHIESICQRPSLFASTANSHD